MNGPQHFAAAEEALAEAELTAETSKFERLIQVASIHIQAAHVAAVIDTSGTSLREATAWCKATAEERAR